MAVGPAVIGTDDALGVARAFEQPHHAVAADIGEGADAAVFAAQGEDRLGADLVGHIVAGIWNVARAPDAVPFPREDQVLFARQYVVGCIELAGQDGGLPKRPACDVVQLVKKMVDCAHDTSSPYARLRYSSSGMTAVASISITHSGRASPSTIRPVETG